MPKYITTAFTERNPPLQCVFSLLFTAREAHGIFIELLPCTVSAVKAFSDFLTTLLKS